MVPVHILTYSFYALLFLIQINASYKIFEIFQ